MACNSAGGGKSKARYSKLSAGTVSFRGPAQGSGSSRMGAFEIRNRYRFRTKNFDHNFATPTFPAAAFPTSILNTADIALRVNELMDRFVDQQVESDGDKNRTKGQHPENTAE